MVLPKSRVKRVILVIIILESSPQFYFFIEFFIEIFLALIYKSDCKLYCLLRKIFIEIKQFYLEFFFHIIFWILQIYWLLYLCYNHVLVLNIFIFFIWNFWLFNFCNIVCLRNCCLNWNLIFERIIWIILNWNGFHIKVFHIIEIVLQKIYWILLTWVNLFK